MTAEKAAEIVGEIVRYQYSASHSDEGDAIKMCLHSLNRHIRREQLTFAGMMEPLPGEEK